MVIDVVVDDGGGGHDDDITLLHSSEQLRGQEFVIAYAYRRLS